MKRQISSPLFSRLSPGGLRNLLDTLRLERTGGVLLIVGALIAVGWANSPWAHGYEALREVHFGPGSLHLDLSVHEWAADGLLAIFFFAVGVELKREIVVGELRRPATAIVPIVAAVGGMAAPALIYLAVNLSAPGGQPHGWAIPTATDIAFAVAVLAIVGRGLPNALRAFLLTLAVVDDLLAIVVIAVFYTDRLDFLALAGSLGCVLGYLLLIRRGVTTAWVLVPVGALSWALMHASGIHATIAGVLLGLAVPALPRPGERHSLAERFEHRVRPVSAGFAVPIFALMSAGVAVDPETVAAAFRDPAGRAVFLGLVVGKPIGILAATWLVSRFEQVGLAPGLSWWDVVGVGALAGIGFTVSLLIAELAFGTGGATDDHAKVAILIASLVAAAIGGTILAARGRRYARGAAEAAAGGVA